MQLDRNAIEWVLTNVKWTATGTRATPLWNQPWKCEQLIWLYLFVLVLRVIEVIRVRRQNVFGQTEPNNHAELDIKEKDKAMLITTVHKFITRMST